MIEQNFCNVKPTPARCQDCFLHRTARLTESFFCLCIPEWTQESLGKMCVIVHKKPHEYVKKAKYVIFTN